MDAVVSHFDPEVRDREDVRQELAQDQAAIHGDIAYFEALSGDVTDAAAAVLRAEQHASILTGDRRLAHTTQTYVVMGLVASRTGDSDKARDFLESAYYLAVEEAATAEHGFWRNSSASSTESKPTIVAGPYLRRLRTVGGGAICLVLRRCRPQFAGSPNRRDAAKPNTRRGRKRLRRSLKCNRTRRTYRRPCGA